MHIPLTKPKLH